MGLRLSQAPPTTCVGRETQAPPTACVSPEAQAPPTERARPETQARAATGLVLVPVPPPGLQATRRLAEQLPVASVPRCARAPGSDGVRTRGSAASLLHVADTNTCSPARLR